MAKFFVGQRVRIVRTTSHVPPGTEGRITDIGRHICTTGWADCGIQPDGYESDSGWSARFDQLEPILPEGAQPLGYSFEQMMSEFVVKEGVK